MEMEKINLNLNEYRAIEIENYLERSNLYKPKVNKIGDDPLTQICTELNNESKERLAFVNLGEKENAICHYILHAKDIGKHIEGSPQNGSQNSPLVHKKADVADQSVGVRKYISDIDVTQKESYQIITEWKEITAEDQKNGIDLPKGTHAWTSSVFQIDREEAIVEHSYDERHGQDKYKIYPSRNLEQEFVAPEIGKYQTGRIENIHDLVVSDKLKEIEKAEPKHIFSVEELLGEKRVQRLNEHDINTHDFSYKELCVFEEYMDKLNDEDLEELLQFCCDVVPFPEDIAMTAEDLLRYERCTKKLLENNCDPCQFNRGQLLTLEYYMDKLRPEDFSLLMRNYFSPQKMKYFGDNLLDKERNSHVEVAAKLLEVKVDPGRFDCKQLSVLEDYMNQLSLENFAALANADYTSEEMKILGDLYLQDEKLDNELQKIKENQLESKQNEQKREVKEIEIE